MGTAVAQWLRCSATNRKVAGSISDGVTGIFYWHNTSDRTMALGVDSTSIRNEYQQYFLGVKSGRYVRLTTLPPSSAVVTKSGNLNCLEPSGHLGPVMGLIYLIYICIYYIYIYTVKYPVSRLPCRSVSCFRVSQSSAVTLPARKWTHHFTTLWRLITSSPWTSTAANEFLTRTHF